ncbi:rhodanese-like domain-containing protein [Gemella cuniculi]|uniref:rhodanese-like domain-containing protein n=1 Tax=Gemella cuniculi TaxID=150240 RepID=UPI0004128E23|nr:rhodanese-like domain-containing protein [Gemella cuniculi]
MKNNKLLIGSIVALLSLSLVGCAASSGASNLKEIKGEELNKIEKDDKEKENYLVIDIRNEVAYKEGHLKHAINISLENIDKSVEEIRTWREKKVVVYSDDASKTKEAVEKLTKQGFKDVSSAQNIKEFNYDLVKFSTLTSAKFQDAIFDTKTDKVFLDAREKKDFDEKHVAGAKNVDSKNLDNLQNILPENKEIPIYTYCYSGNRSAVVAQKLIDLGYKNVYNAMDGTKEFSYKFEMAECCIDENDKNGHNHENHNHSNHDHSNHNDNTGKKDDHSGHNH